MFIEHVVVVVASAFPALNLEFARAFLTMLLHVYDSRHLASTAVMPQTCAPVESELALREAINALVAFAVGPGTDV